jgi:L-amino acid N-acyltransferase YncA
VEIVTATAADWPAIYPFFRQIVDAGETYAYDPAWTSDEARAVWLTPAPDRTVVARDGDTVLGSAHMGPNRPGRGAHVATASFMVDPSQRSRGVGRALGTEMIGWARSAGYHGIQFNAVVETNTAAVRLWQDLGFTIIGTVPEAFDHKVHGLVGLHVMYQRL